MRMLAVLYDIHGNVEALAAVPGTFGEFAARRIEKGSD